MERRNSVEREILAFLIAPATAPVAAAVIWTLIALDPSMLVDLGWPEALFKIAEMGLAVLFFSGVFGIPIAYALALLVGVPVYLFLRVHHHVGYPYLLGAGILIAMLPLWVTKDDIDFSFFLFFAAIGASVSTVFWLIRDKKSVSKS